MKVVYQAGKRAHCYFGFKGYVNSASEESMPGVQAHHALFGVEASFRMARSGLAARPIFHHTHGSIEAHLTVVFCARAISRHIQTRTHMSIKKVLNTLHPLREAVLTIRGELIAVPAALKPVTRGQADSRSLQPADALTAPTDQSQVSSVAPIRAALSTPP